MRSCSVLEVLKDGHEANSDILHSIKVSGDKKNYNLVFYSFDGGFANIEELERSLKDVSKYFGSFEIVVEFVDDHSLSKIYFDGTGRSQAVEAVITFPKPHKKGWE